MDYLGITEEYISENEQNEQYLDDHFEQIDSSDVKV